MGKKNKREFKPSQRDSQAVEERVKKAMGAAIPDENPFKMDNENKIDRFRPTFFNNRMSISETSRMKQRQNRKKQPQRKVY